MVEGQDENLEKWEEYCNNISARKRLKIQKKFLENINNENYTKLYRVVLDKNSKIVKLHSSFAISFCSGKEFVEADFLDGLLTFSDKMKSDSLESL